MNYHEVRRNVRTFGIFKTCQDLAFRALNRIVLFKILKGLSICQVDANFAGCPENYRCLFLDREALQKFTGDAQYELTESFVDDALARGHECLGILQGATLASYGWYSTSPTAIDPPELTLHFDQRYVYMYKSFTHADHRGRRLHAIGIMRALEKYLAQGYKGVISYVECNNFASLRSCHRMGFSDFGFILLTRVFGRFLSHSSLGCKPFGFRLDTTPLASKAAAASANPVHLS